MKTTMPEVIDFACDTVTLVRAYKRFAERHHIGPRLERVLRAIELELAKRAVLATI